MLQTLEIGDPFTQSEVLDTLAKVQNHVAQEFGSLSVEQFFYHTPGVWSAAENLQHLITSTDAVARGLGFPKLVLRTRFGKADQPSRHYAEVRQVYQTALANGGAASGPFIPELDNHPADPQAEQGRLLQAWQKSAAALVKAAQSWKDSDLDSIRLPHPLIGLLTVREMLLWNIYHDLHHLDDVRRLLEAA